MGLIRNKTVSAVSQNAVEGYCETQSAIKRKNEVSFKPFVHTPVSKRFEWYEDIGLNIAL
jgi:hypothetical protein